MDSSHDYSNYDSDPHAEQQFAQGTSHSVQDGADHFLGYAKRYRYEEEEEEEEDEDEDEDDQDEEDEQEAHDDDDDDDDLSKVDEQDEASLLKTQTVPLRVPHRRPTTAVIANLQPNSSHDDVSGITTHHGNEGKPSPTSCACAPPCLACQKSSY